MKRTDNPCFRLTALLCALILITGLLPLPIAAEEGATPTITVDSVTVQQGGFCDVYVRADHLDTLQLIMLAVNYDPDVLTLVSADLMDMQMGGINTSETGRVQLSVMDAAGVSGSVNLMHLCFQAGRAAETGSYPLTLTVLEARGADYAELLVDKVSGAVSVEPAQIPEAYFYLQGSGTVAAGEELSVQLCSWNLAGMAAGQFSFAYDSSCLTFRRARLLSAFSVEDATFSVNDRNEGQVMIAYAAPAAPSEGELLELTFTANEDAAGTTLLGCTPSSLYHEQGTAIRAGETTLQISISPRTDTSETAAFRLEGDEELPITGSLVLTAVVEGASALAAADFTITYDTALVRCVSVEKLLTADEGLCNAGVFLNEHYTDGSISFSLFAPEGITEDTAMLAITLQPVQSLAGETTLTASVVVPVDAQSQPVALTVENKPLIIRNPTFTVTFADHDGTVLAVQRVEAAGAAVPPAAGGKDPTESVHYLHTGWDKSYENITESVLITAVYTPQPHTFGGWTTGDELAHSRKCTACTVTQKESHSWGSWQSGDIRVHQHSCPVCTASATQPHRWQAHQCLSCGQKDAYIRTEGDNVTLYAAEIAQGTQILMAGYTSQGRMLCCASAQWGTGDSVTLNLPDVQTADHVRIFFLNTAFAPLRLPAVQPDF